MLIPEFLTVTAGRVCGVVIGVGLLWQVADKASQSDGEVVVHVVEPGVVILIDGSEYPIDPTPRTPISCMLRPGRHTLTMNRDGRTIYEEVFTLESGGGAVLTARDDARFTSTPNPGRSPYDRPMIAEKPGN